MPDSKLKCTKHGEMAYVLNITVSFQPGQAIPNIPPLCYLCFLETMTRLGVCALYQSEIEKPEENWIPEDLGEQKK